jgi:hypothetical protein
VAGALLVIVGVMLSFGFALLMPAPQRVASPERGPGRTDDHYEAGQPVEIWHKDRWLPGKIQAVGDGRYFVFYDGFSVSWNEWVTAARLRRVPSDPPAR